MDTKLQITQVDINMIRYYEYNTKKHPKNQIDKLKRSIENFGFNVPIILDGNNILIAGHGRVIAAKELGLKELPAVYKKDLTDAQIKAFRIAENTSHDGSEWDLDFVKHEINELKELNYDINLTGFDFSLFDIFQENSINKEESSKKTNKTKFIKVCPKCNYEF